MQTHCRSTFRVPAWLVILTYACYSGDVGCPWCKCFGVDGEKPNGAHQDLCVYTEDAEMCETGRSVDYQSCIQVSGTLASSYRVGVSWIKRVVRSSRGARRCRRWRGIPVVLLLQRIAVGGKGCTVGRMGMMSQREMMCREKS